MSVNEKTNTAIDVASIERSLKSRLTKVQKIEVKQTGAMALQINAWVANIADATEAATDLDQQEILTPYNCEIRLNHN
jgi:hypothetical protein